MPRRKSSDPAELPTPEEVAGIRKVSTRKLHRERVDGKGPAYIKDGRAVRYRADDLCSYINSLPRIEVVA